MEFQEVMKQWARMCNSFRCLPNGCTGCPLVHERCYHEMPCRIDISIIESKVMEWAAEHPEPVYPTWGEYLISKGLLMPYWNEQGTAPYDMYIYAERALGNPIPADTAQKLGIEPKEG